MQKWDHYSILNRDFLTQQNELIDTFQRDIEEANCLVPASRRLVVERISHQDRRRAIGSIANIGIRASWAYFAYWFGVGDCYSFFSACLCVFLAVSSVEETVRGFEGLLELFGF